MIVKGLKLSLRLAITRIAINEFMFLFWCFTIEIYFLVAFAMDIFNLVNYYYKNSRNFGYLCKAYYKLLFYSSVPALNYNLNLLLVYFIEEY